jgi:4-amino-4-deoxy-L-arabinose transferase-like glycosyltransferase
MRRTQALFLVTAAAVVPRLVVLAWEREKILESFVEKSDRFAQTLASSGTFGLLPEVPSAYTQPLYAWFLAGLYWPLDRNWLVVGLAQIVVAAGTAVLVLEIGRRLDTLLTGVLAALIATLHPYLVWHDVHVNRELLDGFLLALITLLALIARERRSLWWCAALGAATGVAILGNSRLALLPVVLAVYAAWPVLADRRTVAAVLVVVVAAGAAVAPWAVRNRVQIGCLAITTDARALWKANNANTYDVLAAGQWIDDVPELPGVPPWPTKAADIALATGRPVPVDECAQATFYEHKVIDFWRQHPGEKARLAAQATWLLWQPTSTVATDDAGRKGLADTLRRSAEPVFMVALSALALAGLFLAPRRFVALVISLEAYNTLLAMLFAGTVRYRVPWDFLLALLAAFPLARAWERIRTRRDYVNPTRASVSS